MKTGSFIIYAIKKHEVDFALVKNKKLHTLIEVKKSEDTISTGLKYFHEKQKPKNSIQLVLELDRAKEKNGIQILPMLPWLEKMDIT